MRLYAFFLIFILSCSSAIQPNQPKMQSINFDQLNEFEDLIEESDVVAQKMKKEVKISAGTQRALQAVSWLYVQGYTAKQKITAWLFALFSSFKKSKKKY